MEEQCNEMRFCDLCEFIFALSVKRESQKFTPYPIFPYRHVNPGGKNTLPLLNNEERRGVLNHGVITEVQRYKERFCIDHIEKSSERDRISLCL